MDIISAGLEWAAGTIGGFCVGSHFIMEHQRLSGLGYCFSASLPPMLAQAAISALNHFEKDPYIFEQLQNATRKLHVKFSKFSKLQLAGDELSPVKHLYVLPQRDCDEEEDKLLTQIADKVGCHLFVDTCITINIQLLNFFDILVHCTQHCHC